MIILSRWAIDETSVVPQQPYTCFISDLIPEFGVWGFSPCMTNVHVANGSSKVFLVTSHRVLHELDLKLLDVQDDGLATQSYSGHRNQPYCWKDYHLSKTGRRVVGVYISCDAGPHASLSQHSEEQSESPRLSRTQMELKFANLFGATDQIETILLDYLDFHSPFDHMRSVTFSPDLSMLGAGSNIFDLAAPGQPQLRFSEAPLPPLRYEANPSIFFSPCNGYLTYIQGNIDIAEDIPATFGLFRICRGAGSIEKLSIFSLEHLIAEVVWAEFHPTLPLLMLTCVAHRESEVKDLAKLIRIIEIDLEALRPVQVTLSQHELNIVYS